MKVIDAAVRAVVFGGQDGYRTKVIATLEANGITTVSVADEDELLALYGLAKSVSNSRFADAVVALRPLPSMLPEPSYVDASGRLLAANMWDDILTRPSVLAMPNNFGQSVDRRILGEAQNVCFTALDIPDLGGMILKALAASSNSEHHNLERAS